MINGKLFAVSVIDITPTVLSSVYLFYDPQYAFLNPGTFCAIREIEYVNQMRKTGHMPQMEYYFLGFFIKDC
jgi:arginyl-tRNA---protein transferase